MSDIALSAETIVARVERLPISRWHNYMRVVVGSATFFDAFDALVIAFVLPVLIPLWQMSPAQVGLLVSSGYVGQVIGCILFGWVAERFGRLRSLAWTIGDPGGRSTERNLLDEDTLATNLAGIRTQL